jgi:hypothetical protein
MSGQSQYVNRLIKSGKPVRNGTDGAKLCTGGNCLNDPLLYTDPSGYKWWSWLLALIDPVSAITTVTVAGGTALVTVGATGVSAYATAIANTPVAATVGLFDTGDGDGWDQIKSRVNNVWRLTNGLFKTDAGLSAGQRTWQLVSRLTWEQPFTGIGFAKHNLFNAISRVEVGYFYGATVMQTDLLTGSQGVTIGSSITLSKEGDIDANNMTLLHEYGHYLQARSWGGVPMLSMSLFSFFSTKTFGWRSTGDHQNTWAEMDANARTLKYFNNKLLPEHRQNFLNVYGNYMGYYDGRFFRNYLFPDILSYLIYDITWSK